MLFSKKQKQPELDVGQKFFKFAAFFFLMFVLYQMYSSDFRGKINENIDPDKTMAQGQLNQKAQEKFDNMYRDTEYEKIKEFVGYIDNNLDRTKGAALKSPNGYLIFVPFDLVFRDNSVPDNKILVHSDEVEFYIDYKIVQKILEKPSAQDKAQAKDSNISEIRSALDDAEYNRLMEEIAKKKGVEYVPPKKSPENPLKIAPQIVPKPVSAEKTPISGAAKTQPSNPSDQAVQPK